VLDLYPAAAWRPLSATDPEPAIGIPRLLIWHTMVGGLRGTEHLFQAGGYEGTESTFGLGGPWDGASLDGVLWQWQRLSRQADAQYDANAWATSIECADGGDSERPYSDAQLAASVELGVWWCHQTGRPAARATTWNGTGFGYHRMFQQWNRSHHSCPGDRRAGQLEVEVWPEIAHRMAGQPKPPGPPTTARQGSAAPAFPLPAGWYFGPASGPRESVSGYYSHAVDLKRWQAQMRARGWTLPVSGHYDPPTGQAVRQFQAEKRLAVDGLIGARTWAAAWTAPVTH